MFEKEAQNSANYFLNLLIERCPHPLNVSQEINCLQSYPPPLFSDDLIDDIVHMFKQINIDEQFTRSTAQKINAFIQKQVNGIIILF